MYVLFSSSYSKFKKRVSLFLLNKINNILKQKVGLFNKDLK